MSDPKTDQTADRAFWGALNAAGALFRWVLASLVTLNGGAILALKSWDDGLAWERTALGFFFSGCVLAVLAAMVSAGALFYLGSEFRIGRLRFAGSREAAASLPFAESALISGGMILSLASLAAFSMGGTTVGLSPIAKNPAVTEFTATKSGEGTS